MLVVSAKEMTIEHQLVDFNIFKSVLLDKEERLDLHSPKSSKLQSVDSLEKSLSNQKTYL